MNSARADQLMSKPVQCCGPDDPLSEAARLMWEHDCGVVTVIGEGDAVVGVITDRDICMAAHHQGRRLAEIPVRSAMSREVVACAPSDSIEAVEALMQRRQVRRVPVIDERGHPIGMISQNDLVRDAAQRRRSGSDRHVVETLAAIGEPRHEPARQAPRAQPLA